MLFVGFIGITGGTPGKRISEGLFYVFFMVFISIIFFSFFFCFVFCLRGRGGLNELLRVYFDEFLCCCLLVFIGIIGGDPC